MMMPSLAQAIWPDEKETRILRGFALVILGTLALWASAKIQVPFYPVPQTMQTFVVLMIGATFGWRLGGLTILAYLAEGAMGLPVFSGTPERGIGFAYMIGPTGGYLLGFFVAAVTVGFLAEKGWDRSFIRTAAAMTIGIAIIYALGVVYLGSLIGWDKPVLELGVNPFVLGDLFKIALAAAVLPAAWRWIGK